MKAPRDKGASAGLRPRKVAAICLQSILVGQNTLDDALAANLDDVLPLRDRALVRAIVTTTLRRNGEIDDVLSGYLTRPLPAKSGITRHILSIATAELLFLRTPPHAAINIAVALAKHDRQARHFSGLVNAVLRKVSRHELSDSRDPARLNTPEWLWRRWTDSYGADMARRIAEAHLDSPPLDLTVADPSQAVDWAGRLGGRVLASGTVRITEPAGPVPQLPGFSEGAWWVQDAAAALPVQLLGDVSGKSALDLCAAPGGKTAQLAAARAEVTALDRSDRRLARLRCNLDRLGLTARTVCADAVSYSPDQRYDVVLVDAPCSATGTIRRHPDLPFLKTTAQLAGLLDAQFAILENAVELTKPGGTLIYCTCSLEPEECEQQIDRLLASHAPVTRAPISASETHDQPHLLSAAGDLRTLPFHGIGDVVGMDGFYACRLRRT